MSGSQEGVWDAVQEAEEEKERATHSSILAWEIPWIEEPGGLYSPRGHKESDTTEQVHFSFSPRV